MTFWDLLVFIMIMLFLTCKFPFAILYLEIYVDSPCWCVQHTKLPMTVSLSILRFRGFLRLLMLR